MTRGINRFKGLNLMLTEINEKYTPIEGLADLTAWVNSGAAPSNDALQKAIDETGSLILKKALSWSKAASGKIQDHIIHINAPADKKLHRLNRQCQRQ